MRRQEQGFLYQKHQQAWPFLLCDYHSERDMGWRLLMQLPKRFPTLQVCQKSLESVWRLQFCRVRGKAETDRGFWFKGFINTIRGCETHWGRKHKSHFPCSATAGNCQLSYTGIPMFQSNSSTVGCSYSLLSTSKNFLVQSCSSLEFRTRGACEGKDPPRAKQEQSQAGHLAWL